MLIFLVFMWVLSQMKDIRRVFQYHGAEHKVVFNFESGKPVNVENAQRFTTFHPRCGTSFLFVVIIVSIVVLHVHPVRWFLAKLLSRIALLPVIAGVSYELIRFAAKRRGSFLATMTAPGLWLQRITTKPPADDQTAVAITRSGRRHGARRAAGRRTRHRLNLAMQFASKLEQLEKRYEELTQQMADPAMIGDARPVPQNHQGAE